MPLTARVDWIVPFCDLDPLEVCWHGNYVRYYELARTALMQRIDYDYPQMRTSGYAWPIIEMFIRYAQPLTYQQHLHLDARLVEWENRLKIAYEIRDALTQKRLTYGHTVQVAVDIQTREMCFVSPDVLREKLKGHL